MQNALGPISLYGETGIEIVTGSWDQRHLMDRGKFWNRPLLGSVVDCGLIDGLIVDRLMALGAVESVPGGYA